MKLHLPKMLRAALVAALALVAYPGQAAITEWDISQWNGYNQDTQTVTVGGDNVITQTFSESTWNDLHGSFVISVDTDNLKSAITLISLTAKDGNGGNKGSIEAMSLTSTQIQANTWTSNAGANISFDSLKAYGNLTFVLTRGNDNKMSVAVYDSASDFTQALATTTHSTAQSFTGWKFTGVTIGGVGDPNASHAAGNDSVQSFTVTKAGYSLNGVATAQDLLQYIGYSIKDLTWNGTAESHAWDTTSSNWLPEGASFHSMDNVIFGTGDMSKEVTVSSNITASAVTVSDNYTLNIGEDKSVTASTLSVDEGKVLTINGGKLETSGRTGAGKISGNGTFQLNQAAAGNVTVNASNFTGTFVFNEGNVSQHDTSIIADSEFMGTLEIRGRIRTSGTNFGGAEKIRFVGDRSSNNTGVWSNNAATWDKDIEITGSNAVQFELSNTLTLTGALSGDGTLMTTNASTLNIQGGGSLGALYAKGKNNSAQVNISGKELTVGSLYAGGSTTNISTVVNAGSIRLSENGVNGVVVAVNEGGTLNISGNNNTQSTSASILLAHWGQTSTLKLNGGTINAEQAEVHLSWTGTGTFEANSGTAYVKGIDGLAQSGARRGAFKLGTADSGSATVVLGSTGLKDISGNVVLELGNGTLGASADWSLSHADGQTEVKANFIGTTERGTVIDTTDAKDTSIGRTITFNNGTTGNGVMTVTGIGTLVLNGASDRTGITNIEGGTVQVGENTALGTGAVNLTGGTLNVGEGYSITNTVNMSSGTLTVDGTIATVNATGGTVALGANGTVTDIEVKQDATITGSTENVTIGIEAQATATMDRISKDGISIGSEGSSIQVQNANAEGGARITYSQDETAAKVTADSLVTNSSDSVTVANQLVVDSVTNSGNGELKLTGSVTADEIAATNGAITLMNQGQNPVEVSTLTIGADKAVAIYTGAETTAADEATIQVAETLSAGANSTLNANLTLLSGSTLTLNGVLALGSTLTLDDQGGITLGGTLAADVATLQEGQSVTLIQAAANTTLAYGADYDGANAGTYFTGLGDGYSIVANTGSFSIKKAGSDPVVPEPTTGTLSLLALAGLMARRRRK